MSDISDMIEDMLDDHRPVLRGFVRGDCLYMQEGGNQHAWIEGKSVVLGEWQ